LYNVSPNENYNYLGLQQHGGQLGDSRLKKDIVQDSIRYKNKDLRDKISDYRNSGNFVGEQILKKRHLNFTENVINVSKDIKNESDQLTNKLSNKSLALQIKAQEKMKMKEEEIYRSLVDNMDLSLTKRRSDEAGPIDNFDTVSAGFTDAAPSGDCLRMALNTNNPAFRRDVSNQSKTRFKTILDKKNYVDSKGILDRAAIVAAMEGEVLNVRETKLMADQLGGHSIGYQDNTTFDVSQQLVTSTHNSNNAQHHYDYDSHEWAERYKKGGGLTDTGDKMNYINGTIPSGSWNEKYGVPIFLRMRAILIDLIAQNKIPSIPGRTVLIIEIIVPVSNSVEKITGQRIVKGKSPVDMYGGFVSLNCGQNNTTNAWEITEGQGFPIEGSLDTRITNLQHIILNRYKDGDVEYNIALTGNFTKKGYKNHGKFGNINVVNASKNLRGNMAGLKSVSDKNSTYARCFYSGTVLRREQCMVDPTLVGLALVSTSGNGNNCLFHAIWLACMRRRNNQQLVGRMAMTRRQCRLYNTYRQTFGIAQGVLMDASEVNHGACIRRFIDDIGAGINIRFFCAGISGELFPAHIFSAVPAAVGAEQHVIKIFLDTTRNHFMPIF
jgi:hypothetical protein